MMFCSDLHTYALFGNANKKWIGFLLEWVWDIVAKNKKSLNQFPQNSQWFKNMGFT